MELVRNSSEFRECLGKWRRMKPKPVPMPEELWEMAVQLARKYGIDNVSKEFTINYSVLKNRMGILPEKFEKEIRHPENEFVDLGFLSDNRLIHMEASRPDGCRLQIEFVNGLVNDAVMLLREFTSRIQ